MNKIILLIITFIFTGCTTLQDASEARGTGVSKEFEKPYGVVWDAVVQVVEASNLDLVAADKDDGKVLAQKGMSAFSYGENVAVFVTEATPESTEVEVVSKRALATNVVAKNWTKYILESIEKLLQ